MPIHLLPRREESETQEGYYNEAEGYYDEAEGYYEEGEGYYEEGEYEGQCSAEQYEPEGVVPAFASPVSSPQRQSVLTQNLLPAKPENWEK